MHFANRGDAGEQLVVARNFNPTLTESLEQRKVRLEEELAQVNEALAALKANPDIEKLLNLIQKIR